MARVKICGITNARDALLAAKLGADAIGIVCVEGTPRYAPPEKAERIFAALPPFVARVLVVAESSVDEVLKKLRLCPNADCVQLHGEEAPEFVEELRKAARTRLIKRIGVEERCFELISAYEELVDAFLLDTKAEGKLGGTGIPHDWNLSREFVESTKKPVILAGGLTPENVGEAIRVVRPYAVDVSSGVEREVGKKDPAKLEGFIRKGRLSEL